MTGGSSIAPELAFAADLMVRDYLGTRRDETVVITTDTNTDQAMAEAVMNAAFIATASVSRIVVRQLPFQGALADPWIPKPLANAVADCDVWIDLTFPYIAGAEIFDKAMKSGRTRYFLGGDLNAGGLVRMFGKVDLDRHYAVQRAFDELITESIGQTVHISNARGSDVRFKLVKHGFSKPRRADQPGLYFIPGSCTMFPDQESVQGAICIDAVFHEYFTPLAEPITVTVDGRIRSVSGGGSERRVMDRALRRAGGGDYGYVIHFTHGIQPAARVTGRSFVEDMRTIGNDAVGFGLPFWVPGGGENHPDGVLMQQTLSIGNQPIVVDGAFVEPELARLASELEPAYR